MKKIIHIVHWKMSGIFSVANTLKECGELSCDSHQVFVLRKNRGKIDSVLFLFRVLYLFFYLPFCRNSIVHSHSFLPFLISVFSKQTVFTFHNAYPYLIDDNLKSILKRFLLRVVIFINKPRFTAVGKKVASYVKSGLDVDPFFIPNGLKISDYEFCLKFGPIKHLGAVGRLDEQKNYISLIKAAKSFPEGVSLRVAGEGIQRHLIEKTIRDFQLQNIDLNGYVDDIIEFNRSIDGLVCSSLYEGCNLFLIEGILLGTPIISTNVGVAFDFPELIFPRMDDDVESMSKSINEWLNIPENILQEQAVINRKFAELNFDINIIYSKYIESVWGFKGC